MRRGRTFSGAVAALLLAAVPLVAQQAGSPAVTLEEAIRMALRASPAMAQREGAVAQAESSERTSGLGAYLPSLSFSSGTSRSSSERFNPTTNTTATGSAANYNMGLSSSLDLFTAGRRPAQKAEARANTEAAEASLIEGRFAVVFTAKQRFFDVVRGAETVRAAEARLERADLALRAAEQKLLVGSATLSDSLRARLEANQARQSLLQAQNTYRAAAYTLGALVGADGPVYADPMTTTEPRPLPLSDEQLIRLAVEQSPAVRTAAAAVRASDAGVSVARAQYFPALRLSGGYNWSNPELSWARGTNSQSASLSLSYVLFNGFAREDQNERAQINLRVARAQEQDAQRQARANVLRAIDAVRLAEQQIALAQEALAVAQEDLRVQTARYELSASTILEQITSQSALVQAELDLIGARYDYQLARAGLEALVGRELQPS